MKMEASDGADRRAPPAAVESVGRPLTTPLRRHGAVALSGHEAQEAATPSWLMTTQASWLSSALHQLAWSRALARLSWTIANPEVRRPSSPPLPPE